MNTDEPSELEQLQMHQRHRRAQDTAGEMFARASYQVTRMEVDLKKLGHAMRQERQQHGISLRAVARAIGRSAMFVSDCERGNRMMSRADLTNYLYAIWD